MLAAANRRPKKPAFERRPIPRNKSHRHYREREKMCKAQYVEVYLVYGIDNLFQPGWNKLAGIGHIPGKGDEKSEGQICHRNRQGQPRTQYGRESLRAAERAPGAKYE